jgi:hypothetical protein
MADNTSHVSRIALPRHIQGALEYVPMRRDPVRYDRSNPAYYRLWLHTSDFVLGTFLELWPNGWVIRVTVREDQGDERVLVRPAT